MLVSSHVCAFDELSAMGCATEWMRWSDSVRREYAKTLSKVILAVLRSVPTCLELDAFRINLNEDWGSVSPGTFPTAEIDERGALCV
jgi:hypothetical protein